MEKSLETKLKRFLTKEPKNFVTLSRWSKIIRCSYRDLLNSCPEAKDKEWRETSQPVLISFSTHNISWERHFKMMMMMKQIKQWLTCTKVDNLLILSFLPIVGDNWRLEQSSSRQICLSSSRRESQRLQGNWNFCPELQSSTWISTRCQAAINPTSQINKCHIHDLDTCLVV